MIVSQSSLIRCSSVLAPDTDSPLCRLDLPKGACTQRVTKVILLLLDVRRRLLRQWIVESHCAGRRVWDEKEEVARWRTGGVATLRCDAIVIVVRDWGLWGLDLSGGLLLQGRASAQLAAFGKSETRRGERHTHTRLMWRGVGVEWVYESARRDGYEGKQYRRHYPPGCSQ